MIYRLLATLFLLVLAAELHAQPAGADLSTIGGTTYVIAYPDTTMNMFDPRYPNTRYQDKAYILIYSAVENRVSIRGAGFNKTELLKAGKFTIVDLMDPTARAGQPITTESNQPNQATFRLEADRPVVVYCYLMTRFGAEAWTPIPVEGWGREYFVAARPGDVVHDVYPGTEFRHFAQRKMAPAEITIVAAYDDTRLTITPNGTLLNSPRTANVTLQANEVYQIQSFVDSSIYFSGTQPDLGGSYITATKPIGVISGNTRTQVLASDDGLAQNVFRNMLMEWLSPVEHHGTEFVYLPTTDGRQQTGESGEYLTTKRKGEHVRIYGTTAGVTTGYSIDNRVGRTDFTISGRGKFREDFMGGVPEARYYRTDRPAQVMMNSTAVVRYNGTTDGIGRDTGSQYDGWGAYMVELVPRERWSSFAPYYAPSQPTGMEHFINVVTDSLHRNDIYLADGSRFIFNRGPIAGTDLVWGTMPIIVGRDQWLEGRNGARFSGHLYGLYKGHEEYRPGRARKEDDAARPASVFYEEYLAVAYGYPLASRHVMSGIGDSLKIDTAANCSRLTITVRALNQNPVGLGTIQLDSAINTRFVSITPVPITGASAATIVVAPIDVNQDARADVVITDRSGKVSRFRYTYIADRLHIDPVGLVRAYGIVSPGASVVREIVFTNRSDRTIHATEVRLVDGTQGFTIDSIIPGGLPVALDSGESFRVAVRASPLLSNRTYIDSLRVVFGCTERTVAVMISTSAPQIEVSDIDFGELGAGVEATRQMQVCNVGTGILSFRDGPGGDLITWFDSSFSITQDQIEQLRTLSLGRDQCVDIAVRFRSTVEGEHSDSARLFANVRDRKDWSRWRATVQKRAGVAETGDADRSVTVRPSPATGATSFHIHMNRPGVVRLVIVDANGREVGAVEQALGAGDRSIDWDASSVPAGIYFYRVVSGERVASGSVVVVR